MTQVYIEMMACPKLERIKKNFQSLLEKYGPEIITEYSKKVVNYLDVTFNLNDGTYKPYHKPDNKITYINVQLNHSPNIIKQPPKTIEQRLSHNSSNVTIFNEAAPLYEKPCQIKVQSKQEDQTKNRKKNIIWFNQPYNKNMLTKVGHYFLKLLDKHFPRQHKLHKFFNKNSVKISNSCTKNIKSIINSHNINVLHQIWPYQNEGKCNCIRKELCPLNGNCQAENIVYEATITSNERTYGENIYIDIAETTSEKDIVTIKDF